MSVPAATCASRTPAVLNAAAQLTGSVWFVFIDDHRFNGADRLAAEVPVAVNGSCHARRLLGRTTLLQSSLPPFTLSFSSSQLKTTSSLYAKAPDWQWFSAPSWLVNLTSCFGAFNAS